MITGTDGHVKTLKLKQRLRLNKWQAVGILETLFLFAVQNADDGAIGKYTNDEIALYLEYFDADADELINALIYAGYVDESEADRLVIHDWNEHAPRYIKDRIAKRRKRANKDKRTPAPAAADKGTEIGINPTQPSPTKPNPTNKKPIKKQAAPAAALEGLVETWNKTPGVRKVRRITDKRRRLLTPRLSCDDWVNEYPEALKKFPLKCFGDGSYTPTLEFFARPDTVNQIIEGAYDWEKGGNGKPAAKPYKRPPPKTARQTQYDSLNDELDALKAQGEGLGDQAHTIRDAMAEMDKERITAAQGTT